MTDTVFERTDGARFTRKYPDQAMPETCPDCAHKMQVHAPDSRIVGCQAGDSGDVPICMCRTMQEDFHADA
jgi:hypothetical protein